MPREEYIIVLNVYLGEYPNLTGTYSLFIDLLFKSFIYSNHILGISSNYRYSQRRIFFKKDEPEPSYGAFAQIQLVENETCNLSPNSVNDTCSKYDSFLARFDMRYYANKYRRQNENLFSFNRPTCNRRC